MLPLKDLNKILAFQFIVLFNYVFSQEILGCGGFIKSHDLIDYSKVQIKLFTKSGSLKDQTECAPNNGYYFLPLYDKGEYVLKVDPPRGWSFEPTEVILDVDGTNDVCSQGKDINFTFKGFGITGKITSSNSKNGPAGVTVSLHESSNKKLLGTTITGQDGIFSFTPIQPGKYTLVASHPKWVFMKDTTQVTVKEGNTELPDNELVVFGYDVSGKVTSEDESTGVNGVSFILFGNGKVMNCNMQPIPGFDNQKPLCSVNSDKSGKFVFPAVSIGEYKIIPHYAGTETKFHVQPQEMKFTVQHGSVILPEIFKVTGFTVNGVVEISNGVPLANAKVFLSGKLVATTDANGRYFIDKMKTGQYSLKVEANDVKFDEKIVKISPSTPELPQLKPSSYKVCGSVTLSAKEALDCRNIVVTNAAGTFKQEINTDPKTGKYCLYLPPGKYQLNVVVSANEKSKGLQFFPLEQIITVDTKPLNDINFLQLKATVTGTLECLENSDCDKVSVTLKVVDGITVKTVEASNGYYEFTEILPGNYQVLIDTDVYCWENPTHRISVTSEHAQVPPFKQTGFSVTFISSHDTAVEFYDKVKLKKVALTLPRGSTRHCVLSHGEYKFVPKSCHIYAKDSYVWDTKSLTAIILTSRQHRHRGKIISNNNLVDSVKVKIESDGAPTIFSPVKHKKDEDNNKYTFEFNAETDQTYVITPLSDIFLFTPTSLKIIGGNDCDNNAATFNAELGKIVEGQINPPLNDFIIRIYGKDKEIPIYTVVTQANGTYRVGPLDGKIDYTVTAEKEGYAVIGPDSNGNFAAHKLAEVIVQVTDAANPNVPLQGVLLSLSGGQAYRKNSMTSEQGSLVFNSLSPGEYYLRPMMKEYRFDPPSKIITVSEGATLEVKLAGNRVAFSAYGSIISLNGDPEPGLVVEAQGQDNCEQYQEEATTEDNGNFRIRGLQPTCTYHIRLKPNVDSNTHIHRISPEYIPIKATEDVTKLQFIAFHPIPRTDVSVHIFSNSPEYYRTLQLKLCREDEPDSSIYVAKIDAQQSMKFNNHNNNPGFLVHLPSLQSNGKKYFLQLDSSLSQDLYKYKPLTVHFVANTSFKAITLTFNAERKTDQGEMSQSSMIVLPVVTLLILTFMNRDKVLSFLNIAAEQWYKPASSSRMGSPVYSIDSRGGDDIIVEQIMNVNKRKVKTRKT
ncbi:nodal modulator 1 [Chelonus insularis]|uniref:nodal modulator 1 n=1 Tax=Chelonus insularis TaxID=460826 RepID=UPI00158C0C2E|nr:nodal modulator 1 [Chelonus insularis]